MAVPARAGEWWVGLQVASAYDVVAVGVHVADVAAEDDLFVFAGVLAANVCVYFVAETNEWGNLVSVREHDTRKPWEGRAK